MTGRDQASLDGLVSGVPGAPPEDWADVLGAQRLEGETALLGLLELAKEPAQVLGGEEPDFGLVLGELLDPGQWVDGQVAPLDSLVKGGSRRA